MKKLNKYFTYFEELSDSLFIVDGETTSIIDFNRQAYESLGYTKDELKKLKVSDIDFYDAANCIKEKGTELKKNKFAKFQTKHVRKDGSLIDVLVKIKPISVEGRNYCLCITQDISENIAKEEKLKKLVEKLEKTQAALSEQCNFAESLINTAQTIVLVLDCNGKIVRFNPYMENLSGYSFDEVKGKDWFSIFIHTKDKIRIREIFKNALEDENTVSNINPIITKDGKIREIMWHSATLKGSKNNVMGMLSIGIDFTERRKLEKKLKTANIKLEKNNNIKSKFLSHMNHEIRTPLNGILGVVDILQDTKLSDEQMELLNIIKESSNNLLDIAVETLDYSKLECGSIQINNDPFDLNTLLDEIMFLFKVEANKKNLGFYLLKKSLLPHNLTGDASKLKQVIINICNNAIKFTHKGYINLKVSSEKETASEINVKFSITDTGIGILEKHKKKLFKKFTQLDAPKSAKYAGVGLGLSISKELVELMGGEIGVDSTIDKGSIFWFTIPFKKNINSDLSCKQNQKKADIKILIAEDNMINTLIEEKMLKSLGFNNIDTVINGYEAVEFYKKNEYDIILMDCLMPEMTGSEAAIEIRKIENNNTHIPIIAITANGREWSKDKCLKAGMDDYIEKPISKEQLGKKINKYLS